MPKKSKEKIIITDVPQDKIEGYKRWAEDLGGKFFAEAEDDGEFTVIITFP